MAFAPYLAMGMNAAGGILGAIGAKQAASAQASAYNYQAAVAQSNAQIMRRNAMTELGVGEEKAAIAGTKGAQISGAIRAGQGASGVQVDSGSSADVQAGQARANRIDQDITRENAGRRADEYFTQEVGYKSQAELDKMGATEAESAGNIKALGSLIGAGTSVADKWMQWSKLGA
jgi:hypothetical protein